MKAQALPTAPDVPPVIVGAGPAGTQAAATLVAHGLKPIVIDEARSSGGQIYRRQPAGFTRRPVELYGTEAAKALALHQTFDGLINRIDYRPQTLVWNVEPGRLDLWDTGAHSISEQAWRDVIVASGATDRVLPVPGWTLPGVYTLGGAQVVLKYQACAIGKTVVFAGTGPLLYLVAYQYAKAGARVAAVIDSARLSDQIAALPDLMRQPATLAKGAYYVAWLQARGIRIIRDARLQHIAGEDHVQSVSWTSNADGEGGTGESIACDAVAMGQALRSETQLADLLDCRFAYSPMHRAYQPETDDHGRSTQPGVYLAGDGAAVMGADAAALAGERAALALLADRGIAVSSDRVAALGRQLAGMKKWRRGMESAFPFPAQWAEHAQDSLVVCRCENVTAGDLRQTITTTQTREINRLKALSRVCMGRCQGRMCATAAIEILAEASGLPVDQVGRLRAQGPIKALPMDVRQAAALVQEALP